MKFKWKFIITLFFSFLSCYNSYIIKNFNQQVEKKYFSFNKKKKILSLNYFSYTPFLNESIIKKKVHHFKIFLKNKKTREKENFGDLNNIQKNASKDENQLTTCLEKKNFIEKKEKWVSMNDENETDFIKNKKKCVKNKKNVKKSKNVNGNSNFDFVNEYKDDLNERNKKRNYNLTEPCIRDEKIDTYTNKNNSKYNYEYPYSNNNNASHTYIEYVKDNDVMEEDKNVMEEDNNEMEEDNNEMEEDKNVMEEDNNEMEEDNNEMEEKNEESVKENNHSFIDNNDDCKKNNEKKKKKNMEIKIIRNLPLISIIGRPNVGKSTIFNRLTRKFQKGNIVLDVSNTRDKVYGEVEWDGYKFEVVDTGGLVFEDEKFSKEIREQIIMSLSESSVVLLVVDGLNGIDPLDVEICKFLRKYIKEKYKKYSCKRENQEKVLQWEAEEIEDKEKRNMTKKKGNNSYEILSENDLSGINEKLINNVENNICGEVNVISCVKSKKKDKEIEKEDVSENESTNNNSTNDKNNVNNNYKKNSTLKVIVCVNKSESYKDGYYKAQEFWELGFGNPFACSGIHGNGLSEILDECIKYIKKVKVNEMDEEKIEQNTINVSFIGKPNTGKSSILNKILNCNRFIVSPLAGTTVDSVDILIKIKDSDRLYRLIDTAGIQKRKKNVPFNEKTKYEYLLYNRTEKAIRRSDVCVLVIDSFNGISSHDINIARKILQENKSCIICCNKWDLIHNKNDIFNETKNYVLNLLKPIDFANILFISAKTSQRLLNIFEYVEDAYKNYTKQVNTNSLNQIIKDALLLRPPIPIKNKSLKIYYAFQAHIKPPGFVFFCNSEKSVYLNYTKYLESRIRESFNIKSTPIKIYYKQRRLRNIAKKTKNPDKYNLDIEAIQKNFLKMQSNKNVCS